MITQIGWNTCRGIPLCLAVLLASVCGCRTTQIINPDSIRAAPSIGRTRAAILDGLKTTSWIVYDEAPDTIHAKLLVNGKHELRVAIFYDSDQVRMQYEDSRNFDYRKRSNKDYIHSNAMVWMNLLWIQIEKSVAATRIET